MSRLRPRWSFSLGTLLALVTAVAAGTWYWSLHEYQAVIVLRLQGPEGSAEFERFEREQIELICSDRVLDAALREPEVANLSWRSWRPASVPALRSKVDFDLPDEDEILGIRFCSPDARTAITIVNALTQAYLHDVEVAQRRECRERLAAMQATLANLQRETYGKQDSSQDKAEGASPDNDHSLTEAEKATLSKFNSLRGVRLKLQGELLRAKLDLASIALESITRSPASAFGDELVATFMQSSPNVVALRRQIEELESTLHRHESSPDERQEQDERRVELDRLKVEFASELTVIRARIARDTSGKSQTTLPRRLLLLDQEREIAECSGELESIGPSFARLEAARVDLAQILNRYAQLGSDIERLRAEMSFAPQATIAAPAFILDNVSVTSRLFQCIGIGVAVFAFFRGAGWLCDRLRSDRGHVPTGGTF